jgi:hypothetical protein
LETSPSAWTMVVTTREVAAMAVGAKGAVMEVAVRVEGVRAVAERVAGVVVLRVAKAGRGRRPGRTQRPCCA